MKSQKSPLIAAMLLAGLFGLVELPFSSFMADDFIQLGILEHVSPLTWIGRFDLYTISDGDPRHVAILKDKGAFPWYFGSEFKMAFFRPLSSALLALDHALFGLRPMGYRAHGAVWFLLLVAGFGWLLREILPGSVGTLALLIFTVSGIHGILCWLASRHIVIAGAAGMLAVAGHVAWRERGFRPGCPLAMACLALSLSASEAGLGTIAYLMAYEALAAPGSRQNRLKAILPAAILTLVYLLQYQLLGRGASGGSGYINPISEPLAFLFQLPERLSVLIGAMILGGNADLWVLRPGLRTIMAITGAVAVVVFSVLLRAAWSDASRDERRGLRFLIAGSLLAAIPFAGTPIGSRCLVVPFVGASVAIAFVLHGVRTRLGKRPGMVGRLFRVAGMALVTIHLVFAPFQRLLSPYLLRKMMFEHLDTAMKEVELDRNRIGGESVVILTAPDLVVGFHSFFYRQLYRLPMPKSWHVLSWAPHSHRVRRVAIDTLVLEVLAGEIAAPHLRKGETVELPGMRATVLDMNRNGPTSVEFRFDRSLEDPSLHFMAWRQGRLRHVDLPPVGQTLLLPFESGDPFR